jgi:hypothetical protein
MLRICWFTSALLRFCALAGAISIGVGGIAGHSAAADDQEFADCAVLSSPMRVTRGIPFL